MYQKFFTKTIESKFIKNLLYNTPLPLNKTIKNGDYIFKDHDYIYNNSIIHCTQSGYINLTYWQKFNMSFELNDILDSESIAFTEKIQYGNKLDITGTILQNISELKITSALTLDILQNTLNKKYILTDDSKIINIDSVDSFKLNLVDYVNQDTGLIEPTLLLTLNCSTRAINYFKTGSSIEIINSTVYDTFPIDGKLGKYWYTLYTPTDNVAVYNYIDSYSFGQLYPKFTEKFISEFGYYDSETHEHLGTYLRCLKSLYGINLMPLYNCYSGRYASNFHISVKHVLPEEGSTNKIPVYSLQNTADNEYKVAQVPIKFNRTYTIALDADSDIYLAPAIISNNRFVSVLNSHKEKVDLTTNLSKGIELKSGSKFKHPFTYRLDLVDDPSFSSIKSEIISYLETNEKNLYLLIQMPVTVTSSLVVLEGDYTLSDNCTKYFSFEDFSTMTLEDQDKTFLSNLSLLKFNDKNSYAFSNRLIEYLSLNVINHLETIDDNIKRVQEEYSLEYLPYAIPGVWDDIIRAYYFKLMNDNVKIEHYDLLGYIDRDTEKECIK